MKRLIGIFLLIAVFKSYAQIEFNLSINEIYIKPNERSWVELYNYGDVDINFQNAYLSDDYSNYKKWKFKNDRVLKPQSYYVFYLDSTDFESFDIGNFSANSLFLNFRKGSNLIFIDDFSFKNKTVSKYGRIPDGLGSIEKIAKPSPFQSNKVRTVLAIQLSPNIIAGTALVNYRQTQGDIKAKPGFYFSRGIDLNVVLLERYRAVFGLNYSDYKYNYYSNDKVEKAYYYYEDKLDGSQKTKWAELKLPLIYNSVRVYQDFWFDFGFLLSIKRKEHLVYDLERNYYSNNGDFISYLDISYDSKDDTSEPDGGDALKAPLILKLSYQKKNLEGFISYYLRKDANNETTGDKRNTKTAISVGLAYNFNVLRIR